MYDSKEYCFIPPKDNNYTKFTSENSKIEFLKKIELLSPTAKSLKEFYYNGPFVKHKTICEVIGYINDNVIVIKVDGNLHCIDKNCFKEMQKSDKKAGE